MSSEEKPYPTDYNVLAFVFDGYDLADVVSKDVEANYLPSSHAKVLAVFEP